MISLKDDGFNLILIFSELLSLKTSYFQKQYFQKSEYGLFCKLLCLFVIRICGSRCTFEKVRNSLKSWQKNEYGISKSFLLKKITCTSLLVLFGGLIIVPAPIVAASTIQKLCFEASDYRIIKKCKMVFSLKC